MSLRSFIPSIRISCRRMASQNVAIDPQQLAFLEERCLLVDQNDTIIGDATKRDCHTWSNILTGNMLHRAFSVFIFNEHNELLMQQRSAAKITFPLHWTNACCSHPLNVVGERDGLLGVKQAAQRKLQHELGIHKGQIESSAMQYVTRIMYRAQCGKEPWGEHEVDYVLLVKQNVELDPNSNEVNQVKWLTQQQLHTMIEDKNNLLTPWFQLIATKWLTKWWDNLDDLHSLVDHETIHSFA